MKCPHCGFGIYADYYDNQISGKRGAFWAANSQGVNVGWMVRALECPECKKAILSLAEIENGASVYSGERFIQPKTISRPSASAEVPIELAEDYNEACAVVQDSAKASAALSRRCLQGLLRLNGYTKKDLAPAIDEILKEKRLPSYLAESLDAVRNIGNFAAHPMKDTNTGAIVPVEPHEAEWNLDVLEELFNFFYVAPAKEQKRRDALNAKLAAIGKPPMKQ
jgi:hypothetical protein